MSDVDYKLQGQNGGIVLSDGDSWSAGTGQPARWVSILSDTELSTYAGNLTDGSTKLVGETLVAGLGIPGQTTSIAVTTGLVIVAF